MIFYKSFDKFQMWDHNYRVVQAKYALLFGTDDIDEVLFNDDNLTCVETKCSIGAYLFPYLVSAGEFIRIDKIDRDIEMFPLYRFSINPCIGRVGHVFCVFYINDEWYLVHSYMYEFPLRYDRIDIDTFLNDLDTLREGYNPELWMKMFGTSEPETGGGRVRCEIEACSTTNVSLFEQRIDDIDKMLAVEVSNPDSYIHMDEYSWIVSEIYPDYLQ